MARTLATDKQAEAIKRRMAEIRSDLPYAADEARQRLSQLTDWRYHMARHPWPIIGFAITAGYVLVPRKRMTERVVVQSEVPSAGVNNAEPAKKGLVAGVVGTLTTLALRHATTMAASQIGNLISSRGSK